MNILGIESSCDETAAALLEVRRGKATLHSNIFSSQIDIHAHYGGVVPEVAARNHVLTIIPVIQEVLGAVVPDTIAVTAGPGLVTSLSVGVTVARTLSFLWNIPLIPINHIEGHLYANWLGGKSSDIQFPALVLIVSGGHTELIMMSDHGKYKKIGQTLDDAAGEAFDKVAKILGLPYPGGPAISRMAVGGDAKRFDFPRALLTDKDRLFDFSFSGLKTSVLYLVRDLKQAKKYTRRLLPHICASFEQAVVDVLVSKTLRAVKKYRVRSVLLGGGVVASTLLRAQIKEVMADQAPQVKLFIPELKYCTDNAAMIAVAASFHAKKKDGIPWQKLDVRGGWEL